MVSTRLRDKQQQVENQTIDDQQQPQAGTRRSRIPTAVEQEQQLQADRAKIQEYRKQWQAHNGVGQAAVR